MIDNVSGGQRKAAGGRPSKRTPENRAAILLALIHGNTLAVAASAGGMSRDTLNEWRKADADFSDALETAEHEAQRRLLAIIERAAEKSWFAAAWMMERRWSGSYGRRDKMDMTVDVKSAAEKVASQDGLDADEIMAEAERIVKAGA